MPSWLSLLIVTSCAIATQFFVIHRLKKVIKAEKYQLELAKCHMLALSLRDIFREKPRPFLEEHVYKKREHYNQGAYDVAQRMVDEFEKVENV